MWPLGPITSFSIIFNFVNYCSVIFQLFDIEIPLFEIEIPLYNVM